MSSIEIEPENLPDPAPHNHGKTTAAWVANIGITIGFVLGAIGFSFSLGALLWGGVAIVVLSAVAGGIMRLMGKGQVPARQ